MKIFYLGVLLFLISVTSSDVLAQATFTQGSNAAQLAAELSVNGGFTISGPVITSGANNQKGTYSNGAAAGLSLDRGILLSTGTVNSAFSNQSSFQGDEAEQGGTTYDDSDLTAINAQSNYDVVVYEFDFTILGTEPKVFALDYQFASEEYPDYVCSDRNDIFGFFVSGGDLVGTTNLAQVGGSNTTVNNINHGTAGASGDAALNPCTLSNSASFVQNFVLDGGGLLDPTADGPHYQMFNGFTTKLRAYTILRPGEVYHMKMAIADTADDVYDSGVFVAPIQIFDIPAKANIDFDGTDDYINTATFLGNLPGATMSAWVKLDNGFSSIGDVCGQDNFRIFVDGANRLKTQAKTGSTTYTHTLTIQDNTPADGILGFVRIRINAGAWLQFNVGGFLTNEIQPAFGSGSTSYSFEASPGDNIEIQFRRNGATFADMNDTAFELRSEDNTLVHSAAFNTLTGNTANTYAAACAGCSAPVTVTTPNASAPVLNTDMWYHATSVYDGTTGTLTLFLNGEQVWQGSGLGSFFNAKDDINNFEIGRRSTGTTNYFRGGIDEVKVFNRVLTTNQIREQVYQEVQNVGGDVTGVVIPRAIDGGAIPWNDLILYYDMNLIFDVTIIDNSASAKNGFLNNITSVMVQDSPLPFVANASGTWTNNATWQYGSVWDVTSLPHKDWAIVQVTDNAKVTSTNSHTTLGLLVDAGSELEMQNDQLIQNTKYVRLDGQIDLVGESQLIQTAASELDVVSAGYIERDQQGKTDVYEYNHWSSPVGAINTTANNADFTLATIVHDGTDPNNPIPVNFQPVWNGAPTTPITIADTWIYKFANHPDVYANWFLGHVQSTGDISPGEGYSQKGSGAATASQNYVFVGKPNNGVIQKTVSPSNLYLLGNPYPSALDANQFILDNIATMESAGDVIGAGITTGALYFWEHWGGNTHGLSDYQGGYATYNLTGATLAVPDPDVSSIGSGSRLPKRYVPVGQGFFVQGSLIGGTIEFNNGQRAFQREMDGNSEFISRTPGTPPPGNDDEIQRVYFKFTTPEGPQRQLLLGIKAGLADGINYGYDADRLYAQRTDCAWKTADRSLVIQAIGSIDDGLELPLEVKVGNTGGICKFETEGLEQLEDGVEAYFLDKQTGKSTRLVAGTTAQFELGEGLYNDRFYVTFRRKQEERPLEDLAASLIVYQDGATGQLMVTNETSFSLKSIKLYNILGQVVMNSQKKYVDVTEVAIDANVAEGTYVLSCVLNDNKTINRKIIIKNNNR